MTANRRQEEGFSAVELLISLFIAAAFIVTSFRLFSVVIQDGNEARLRARAGNIASESLREYAATAPTPCSTSTPPQTFSIPAADLPSAQGTVSYSCPYGSGARTTRVSIVVSYDVPQQSVRGDLDVSR